ncbi:MAG TPA: anhydro-N-acetylmuramic acid kinase [Rhodocyclaceae bacterium]|nr:anhydro-N-acetylmuramic acid kinase [Rhodocyclaceae bacterium]
MTPSERYIGLMSGTSLDGIDAALVQIDGNTTQCLGNICLPYPDDLRTAALALHTPGADDLHHAALFGNRIAELYAQAVSELLAATNATPQDIAAIGAHGQTVRHNPAAGYTLQLINPALLAERSSIRVVADFRSRDIAAGGQGAPLVPAFHDAILRHPTEHRVVLNLGGIANITDLAPGKTTRGFDTGPGNMLLDAWIRHQRGLNFDADGTWAATGKAREGLLTQLMHHAYLALPPPKSCGREEFNLDWLRSQLDGSEAPEDVQASLVEFSARSIADAVRAYCGSPDTLLACGGGARNRQLMSALARNLPDTHVATTDSVGIDGDALEAIAFAWLAYRTLHGLSGNLPAVTGARGERILGAIYPA